MGYHTAIFIYDMNVSWFIPPIKMVNLRMVIIALLTLPIFNSSNVEVAVGLQSVYIPTFESSSWPIMAPIFVAQYIMYAPLHMSYSLCSHVELYAHTHRRTHTYIYDYKIILYNYII
jgi:hypothetical protein